MHACVHECVCVCVQDRKVAELVPCTCPTYLSLNVDFVCNHFSVGFIQWWSITFGIIHSFHFVHCPVFKIKIKTLCSGKRISPCPHATGSEIHSEA